MVLVLSTDPNACDTGTLVLKATRATISENGLQSGTEVEGSFELNTTTVAQTGSCHLYGGDPNNNAQLRGGVSKTSAGNGQCHLYGDGSSVPYIGQLTARAAVADPNTFGYGYFLRRTDAPLNADPVASGILAAKACNIPTDFSAAVTVPCVQ